MCFVYLYAKPVRSSFDDDDDDELFELFAVFVMFSKTKKARTYRPGLEFILFDFLSILVHRIAFASLLLLLDIDDLFHVVGKTGEVGGRLPSSSLRHRFGSFYWVLLRYVWFGLVWFGLVWFGLDFVSGF